MPPLQLQLALEHVATVTASITAPHRLYTDGSLQSDGAAGCAVFSPDLEPPPGGWVGRRLHDHSSSTLCELYAILDAVSLVCQRGVNAVIICDSKPALQSLSAVHPTHPQVVQQILSFLSLMNARKLQIKFLWVPPHVGLPHNARTVSQGCREASQRPHHPLRVHLPPQILRPSTRSHGAETKLSLHACGWATIHRGRSPGWRGSHYLPNVVCAAHHCQTPLSSTAWPAPLSVVCYPKDSRWILSAATSWTTIL